MKFPIVFLFCGLISVNNNFVNAQCTPGNVVIGGLCKVDDDCVSCPNSHCNPETILLCRCNSDFVPKHDLQACLPIRNGIGETCEQKSQCTSGDLGSLSDCIGGKCECSEGSVYVESVGQCLPESDIIGGPCTGDVQCTGNLGSEAICVGGQCGCRVTTSIPREDGTFCLPFVYNFEDLCEIDAQCRQGPPAPGPLSYCDTTCKCDEDTSIKDPWSGVCLPKAGMGEGCTTHDQCQSILGVHGFCKIISDPPGTCGCNEDTSIPDGSRCLVIVNELGKRCGIHRQCQSGLPGPLSECRANPETEEKVCQCHHKAVTKPNKDNVCYDVAPEVGDPCEFKEQCTESLGHLSECVSPGNCHCSPGSVANTLNNKCIPGPLLIGNGCHDNKQCPVQSSCSENYVCECNSGMTPSSNKKRCLPIINSVNRQVCEEDQQCKLGSPGVLSDCRTDIWRQFEVDKKCNCLDSAVDVPGHHICYLKAVQVGDPCETLEQCTSNLGSYSECANSICVCSTGAVEGSAGTFCFPGPGKVGAQCDDVSQCPPLSTCEGEPKTCQCVADHVGSGKGDKCLRIVNTVGVDNCEESVQCEVGRPGKLSECQLEIELGKVCHCKDNEAITVPEHHFCYPLANIVGDKCSTQDQCFVGIGPLSECVDGTCGCMTGAFVTPDKKCAKGPLLIGDECEDWFQCPVESTCLFPQFTCECNRGFISSSAKNECLPIVNYLGRPCKENQQCRVGDPGLYSECKKEISEPFPTCKCTSDATSVEGQEVCYPKASLVGGPCQYQEQCQDVESSYCDLGRHQCLCDATHIPSSNNRKCLKKADLGETCEDLIQCQAPDSICLGSKCQCKSGYETPPAWENACYRVASQIGDSCSKGEFQCRELEGVSCRQNQFGDLACLCVNPNDVISMDRKRCLPSVGLGEGCEEEGQCQGSNLECSLATCRCKLDHIESAQNRGNCVKLAHQIYDPCDEDLQCTAGIGPVTSCRLGRCECYGASQYFEGYCYYPAKLGMLCSVSEECVLGVNNRTHCTRSLEGSQFELCRCIPGAIEAVGLCWANKTLGDSCAIDEECRVSIVGGAYCEIGTQTCRCLPGYKPMLGNTFCGSGTTNRYRVGGWWVIFWSVFVGLGILTESMLLNN